MQIAGAGPAGLATAITLARAGCEVIVHEARSRPALSVRSVGPRELDLRAGRDRGARGARSDMGRHPRPGVLNPAVEMTVTFQPSRSA
ncbi:MAG TPA: NAD(P)-binding protein [Casimicrobiaceae bacterium]